MKPVKKRAALRPRKRAFPEWDRRLEELRRVGDQICQANMEALEVQIRKVSR